MPVNTFMLSAKKTSTMKKVTVSRSKSSVREETAAYAFGVSNERGDKLDKILDKIDELEFYKYMILFVEDTTYLDGIDLLKRWWDAGRTNNYKEFLDVYEPDEDTFVYPWEAEKKPFKDAGIEYGGELDQGLPLEEIYQKYIAMMNDGNLSFWKFVTELEPFDFDGFLDDELSDLQADKSIALEAVEDLNAGASYEEIEAEVDDLPLEEFCKQLDFLVKSDDDKAKALYNTFRKGWKQEFKNIKVSKAFVNIRELHPTQNVIFAHKSLDLILNGKWKMPGATFAVDVLLGDEKPQVEMGDPIVVCNVGGVDYLIDGHHRWSKAYAFNPSCSMKAYIINEAFKDADEVLKFAQGTLTVLKNKSPINNAQPSNDINLYDITPQQLSDLVNASLNREVLKHIRNLPVTKGIVNDPATLVSYLWSNVRILRQYAPKGSHDREFMPQFPDGDTNPANAVAKIAENARITLTIGQIRRLIKESQEPFGDARKPTEEGRPMRQAPSVGKHFWDDKTETGEIEVYLGKIADGSYYPNSTSRRSAVDITVRIDKQGYFAVSGSIWNARGTDINRGGQCVDDLGDHKGQVYPQLPEASRKILDFIVPLWEKYHLKNLDRIPEEELEHIKSFIRDSNF